MKTAISIPDDLHETIESFLDKSDMTRSEFFQRAARLYLDKFAARAITANLDRVYADTDSAPDQAFRRAAVSHFSELTGDEDSVIVQGEVHWIDLASPKGSKPAYRRPCVVVQNDAFNSSRISTVVVAAITSNLRLGQAFGNVTLRKGEAGLRRRSVVNISQLTTVDREMLDGRIGRLSRGRLDEVLRGIHAMLRPVAS